MNEAPSHSPALPGNPQPVAEAVTPASRRQGAAADILPLLESRLKETPDDVRLLLSTAGACIKAGRWEEALGHARRADALAPSTESFDLVLDSLCRLGDQDALDQVLPIALDRSSHDLGRAILSMHLMKDRQFVRSFALLREITLKAKSWYGNEVGRDDSIPVWDGKPFKGRLLVIAEQALGEELLGSSAFARIAAMGQETIVECDKRLIPLYQRSFPSLAFVPRSTEALAHARSPGCRKTSISEAAGLVICPDDDFQNPPGWLIADPERTERMHAKYQRQWPGKIRVGISWRSFRPAWGSTHKSLELADLAPLLRRPGMAFFCLQYGDVRDELAALAATGDEPPFQDPDVDAMASLDDFAAQVAAMDVVVTTSNTTAHMAGALGKPTILMLHTTKGVFSYWCYEGQAIPWYPTMRIVRGDAATPMPDFVEAVASELARMMTSLSPTPGRDGGVVQPP